MTRTSKMPTSHRVPVDRGAPLRPPRLGKIRLGEQAKNSKGTLYPKATDYFRVSVDESSITSPAAAAAFRHAYGDQPRTLHVMLLHDQVEHVMESAYRLYGANKLKRICNGSECSVRQEQGGWIDGACQCDAEGLAADDSGRCTLTHTIWLALPDLRLGPGLWELDTGSEISERELRDYLLFIERVRPNGLMFHEFDLELVPTKVAPDGKSKTVYTLHPVAQASERTIREMVDETRAPMIDAGDRPGLPPAPVIDTERDALISPTSEEQAAAEVAEKPLHVAVAESWKNLTDEGKGEIVAHLGLEKLASTKPLIERWGEDARDLEALLEQIHADHAGGVTPAGGVDSPPSPGELEQLPMSGAGA